MREIGLTWMTGLSQDLSLAQLDGRLWWLVGSTVALAGVWTWRQVLFQRMVWLIASLFYRFEIRGVENWPKEGGLIVVANHSSWLDG